MKCKTTIEKILCLFMVLTVVALVAMACDGNGTGGCETTSTPTPTPTPDPISSEPLLLGRFDTSDPAGPRASWSASTIKANFEGTDVGVNLTSSGDNWFNVIIDGSVQAPVNITPGTSQPVLLASGLASGPHTIEIVKRTEAYQGEMQFFGFVFPNGGTLLAAPEASARRIEFIGDSITCGYGNEGESQYQTYTAKNENAYLAYGSITARLLGADQITIAAGGKGVLRDYGGSTYQQMPELYPRTIIWDPDLIWDFTQWVPQVVVINLATNDYSTGIPDRSEFTKAYTNLVKKVRDQYADAVIYCAIGPMLWGDGLVSARDYVSSMVNQLQVQGDANVKYIEFPMQTGENGYGEDWHPSVKTHGIMANQLAARIRADLGW